MKNYSLTLLLVLLSIQTGFAQAGSGWATLQRSRFKIMMPKLPKEVVTDLPLEFGTLKLHSFQYQVGIGRADDQSFMLMYSDYPADVISSDRSAEDIESFFDFGMNWIDGTGKFRLLSQQKIRLKNYPGRQAQVAIPGQQGIMTIRMYLVGTRSYVLQYICKEDYDGKAAAARFFNSFELMGKG